MRLRTFECLHDRRYERQCSAIGETDPQGSSLLRGAAQGVLDYTERSFSRRQQALTRGRQLDDLPGPVKQRDAEKMLELSDRPAQCGLRQRQAKCCARETALLCHRDEAAEVAKFDTR